MDDLIVERVLRCVEAIPTGRVVSYGDIARIVGIGPRQVGAVMSAWGSDVPWWRVTSHAGDFPGELLRQARPHWTREGIVVKPNGLGCRIADYRADLTALEHAWRAAIADLSDDHDDIEDLDDTRDG